MVDPDPHTLATFVFAQLQRDPSFRSRYRLRNVYVCIETDLMVDVRREAQHHFPDGGEIACYFPQDQRLMFIRHPGVGQFQGADTAEIIQANDKAGAMTVGMIVDMIHAGPNWMDQLTEVSTRDVEKQPIFG